MVHKARARQPLWGLSLARNSWGWLVFNSLSCSLKRTCLWLGQATYADKLSPPEFEIDWQHSPQQIDRLVRLGGAWTTFRGKRLKIHRSDLVDGRLVPTSVQPEGKAAMTFDAWRNGARPSADEIFGDL